PLATSLRFLAHWSRHQANRTGCIEVSVETGSVTLKLGSRNSGWYEQRIPLCWTACNYGGGRAWFRCAECDHRAAKLYFVEGRFACRQCSRLSYASQREGRLARQITRAQK